jgi:ketosteroid isomerase-like protein
MASELPGGPPQRSGLMQLAGHHGHGLPPEAQRAFPHCEPIRPATASSPAEALALLCEALSDGDVEAALSLYEPGALLVLAPRGELGHERCLDETVASLASTRLVFEARPLREVLAGDVALLLAARTVIGKAPDGASLDEASQGAAVLRNSPSQGWRFVLDYWGIEALAALESWLGSEPQRKSTSRAEPSSR